MGRFLRPGLAFAGTSHQASFNSGVTPYLNEVCYDVVTGAVKIGDGVTPYKGLRSVAGTALKVSPGDTFTQTVAKMNLDTDYWFGTDPSLVPSGATWIYDLVTLAASFNAFEDGTGKVSINAELQRYKDFNSVNHVFAADRLNLTADCTIATPWPVYTTNATGPSLVPGTANAIALLGLATTAGIFVGDVVVIKGKGVYYITAVVTDTSITFSQFAGSASSGTAPTTIFMVTGYVYAFLGSATTRTNDLSFMVSLTAALGVAGTPGVPTRLAVGMQPGANSGTSIPMSRVGDVRITNINLGTGVVTLAGDASWTQGDYVTGTGILFGPAMTSGQIWHNKSHDLFGGGFAAVAYEQVCYLPPADSSATVTDTSAVTTAALYSALPTNVPMGYWSAYWLYTAQNFGNGIVPNQNATEMDIFELYTSCTTSLKQYTGGNVVKYPSQGTNRYVRTLTGDSQTNAGQQTGATVNTVPSTVILTLATPMKDKKTFGFIWTPERTYRYIDDQLVKIDDFFYYSMNNAQYGVNLAVGSFQAGLGGNLQMATRQEHMQNMKHGIQRLRTWTAL